MAVSLHALGLVSTHLARSEGPLFALERERMRMSGPWRPSADSTRPIADIAPPAILTVMTLDTTLQALVGKPVRAKTIPGNTIEVWLDVPPRSVDAIVVAMDAPWRILGPDEVMATSAEIPWEQEAGESKAEYRTRNENARKASDFLVGLTLTSASCDRITGDLTLRFEGGFTLQGFTVWRDEPPWSLRLYAENRRLGPDLDEPIRSPH